MNIDIVRSKVESIKGKSNHFRFVGPRNKIDEFDGIITSTYPAIFIVVDNEEKIRSFSYSDIITSNLEIVDI